MRRKLKTGNWYYDGTGRLCIEVIEPTSDDLKILKNFGALTRKPHTTTYTLQIIDGIQARREGDEVVIWAD